MQLCYTEPIECVKYKQWKRGSVIIFVNFMGLSVIGKDNSSGSKVGSVWSENNFHLPSLKQSDSSISPR